MKIVMVHGIWDTGRIYRRMKTHLSEQGHECHAPNLKPANAKNGLRELTEQLSNYVDKELPGSEPIAVVGFSMGTLIARDYIQNFDAGQRTRYFFAISGPNRGTLAAHIWPGKAARDMRFGSRFLKELNADVSAYERIEVHSFRTPFDLLIIPSRSTKVTWALNHTIPAAFHHRMVVQSSIIEHIDRALAGKRP